MTAKVGDLFYRIVDQSMPERFCSMFEETVLNRISPLTFQVIKVTPKGVRIVPYYKTEYGNLGFVTYPDEARFVRTSGVVKQFAHATLASAVLAYAARKSRQVQLLTAQLDKARRFQAMAQKARQELAEPNPAGLTD